VAPWQQFAAARVTSFDIRSAWTHTWQSMLQKRGPAAEAMRKALFNPSAKSEGVAPLMDELQDVFALPHFADLQRLDASALLQGATAPATRSPRMEAMLTTLPPTPWRTMRRAVLWAASHAPLGLVSSPGSNPSPQNPGSHASRRSVFAPVTARVPAK